MAAYGSFSTGSGVDYYTQGAGERAGGTNYYTGAVGGEPPGRWRGAGAEALGLAGDVDPKVMRDLYERGIAPDGTPFGGQSRKFKSADELKAERLAAEPYASAERIREIERECAARARESVNFVDFTLSLDKASTVLHTAHAYAEEQARRGGDQSAEEHHRLIRTAIEEAGQAAADAAVDYLAANAGYTRTGRGGTANCRWVDAHDVTTASFFQHTSREGDPQLHWHNVILTSVRDDTGKVHKLDTTLIREHRGGASAHGARVFQEVISERLGWEFEARTDGNGHEPVGVDQQVKDLFSERRQNITKSVEVEAAAYEEEFGHAPNSLVLTRMKQQASLKLRPKKPSKDGETRQQQMVRNDQELRDEIGSGLGRIAATTSVLRPQPEPEEFSPHAVIARAIARVQETQATFSRSDLVRAIEAELPGTLGCGPDGALELIEGLADEALAACTQINNTVQYRVPGDFKLQDGSSSYRKPGSTKFSSEEHIRSEHALQGAAVEQGYAAVDAATAEAWIRAHARMGMSRDQAAALKGIMTSGARLTTLVGPAGAGKTFVLGGLAAAWKDTTGGRVYGLATSEQASHVMRGEGVQARNTAQWLGAQRRIREGRPLPQDEQWRIREGDFIVPDESSMTDTPVLAEVIRYAKEQGARVLLTGDPKQLSAVGAGGSMDLVVNTDGADVHELTEVRRFSNTWEGSASLRLRQGDVTALDQYLMHDRVRSGGTEEQALGSAARLYVGDRLDGKSAVVVTPTNGQAAKVNGMIRGELVARQWVEAEGVFLPRDGNHAGVGDIIKCRKVIWTPGNELRNQGRYVVKQVNEDGSLEVTEEGSGAARHVEATYVEEFVELGYAGTVHSVQGMTCDTGIPVIMEGQPLESVYPAMTRGRERNTAIVVTEKQYDDPATLSVHTKEPLTAHGVLQTVMSTEHDEAKAALTQQAEALARETSLKSVSALYEETMRQLCRDRTTNWLDELTTEGLISVDDRQRLAVERGAEQLGRLLRVCEQAGHDPKYVLREAVTLSSLEGARMLAPTLHARIAQRYEKDLRVDADACIQPPADTPEEYQKHFEELEDIRRQRRSELGREQAEHPSPWAVEILGEVPEDVFARTDWEDRAGHIAAHREASGWEDEDTPLGPAPGMGKTEMRAQWTQAWSAAGRPESTAEEHEMSEGALRNRVRAMERAEASLPPNVYQEMRAVEEQIMEARHKAAEARNAAEAVVDDFERARVGEEAAEHESYAERWEAKRAGLQEQDDARRLLRERTAITRELGERAYRELTITRDLKVNDESDRVTADQWLAEEHRVRAEDDRHRTIAEEDLEENTRLPNERVDERGPGVIAAADSDLPANVPTDEDVAVGVLATQVAYDRAADQASQERAGQATETVQQEWHEQQVRARETEQAWDEVDAEA